MRVAPHKVSYSLSPLVTLAVSFAAGVLAAHFILPPLAWCIAGGGIFTSLALASFLFRKLTLATFLLIAAFACAGLTLAQEEKGSVLENRVRLFYERGEVASGDPVEVTGVLERAPESAPDGMLLSLRVEGLRVKTDERVATGRVELFAPVRDARASAEYAALELRRGGRVRVMSTLTRADRYQNPGVSTFTEYLEREDVDARGTIKSSLLIERLDDERVLLPRVWLEAWRTRLLELLDEKFSADTAGVLKAAMLGNRYGLSHATAERFREGGTFHVLVISGLHITFIGGIVWMVAGWLTNRRAWRWTVTVALVWSYAVTVGAEASVVRAALMFSVITLAPVLGRRASSLNALGGAALVLLVWSPRGLFDPSFQLTFLSVLAIVALAWPLLTNLKAAGEWHPTSATPYPPVCPRLLLIFGETLYWSERDWRRGMTRATHSYVPFKSTLAARLERWHVQKPLRWVFAAVLISATVQLVLLPLLVLYFHRLSFASLLLNIFVGVLMAALSFVALAAALLSQLNATLAAPFVRLAESINRLMTHSVDPFANVHLASVRLPEYTGAAACVYAIYFVPLVALIFALSRWHCVVPVPEADAVDTGSWRRNFTRIACVALVSLFALIVAHPLSAGRATGRLRIDFLDVGQGDAALLMMPDGETLLVDGGGRPNTGARARAQDDENAEPFERDTRSVGDAVVSEYLWWRGLERINYVLATHADADHGLFNAKNILDRLSV